jgi:hypothetical protein
MFPVNGLINPSSKGGLQGYFMDANLNILSPNLEFE